MNADEYVRKVDSALRDLPWSQRRDLVSELPAHLSDVPAGTDLAERFGTPEQYAADLRAAAGIDRRRGPIAFVRARRPRNVFLTATALALAGLIAGGIAWVQSYQPLIAAGSGPNPTQLRFRPNGAPKPLQFHKGGHFRIALPIENNGSFAVRIVGLGGIHAAPVAFLPHPPLPFTYRLLMKRPSKNWDERESHLIPFKPFDLAPGEGSMIVVYATYAKTCRPWEPRDVADVEPTGFLVRDGFFPIRYRFLWKTSTFLMSPMFPLRIGFPKECR
jgi:HAAS domain-containing protein